MIHNYEAANASTACLAGPIPGTFERQEMKNLLCKAIKMKITKTSTLVFKETMDL